MYAVEVVNKPERELFVWAVFFNRMSLAKYFWERCPDQIGSALVANLMFKSMAKEANSPGKRYLADELRDNAELVGNTLMTLFYPFLHICNANLAFTIRRLGQSCLAGH